MPRCNKKLKSLNCRAIRPDHPTADAIAFVELDLNQTAICARIDCLNPLILLRLQYRWSRHAEEGGGDENAGNEEPQKGEGFHHLVLPNAQPNR
jgi:hypothetical protein